MNGLRRFRRILVSAAVLFAVTSVALAEGHRFFRPELSEFRTATGLAPKARAMVESERALVVDTLMHRDARDDSREQLRQGNPEWDFMSRTYLTLALANIALRDPDEKARSVAAIDAMVDDTMDHAQRDGAAFFALPYMNHGELHAEGRSLFIDGEVALMLAARQLLEPREDYRQPLRDYVGHIVQSMKAGPVASGESYPDECWTFCNTTALVALRVAGAAEATLDAGAHREVTERWLAVAKDKLVDKETGLLVSSYAYDGRVKDGPEGSSIFMSAHNLLLVDEAFARHQFELARANLGDAFLGFGYAREWPASANAVPDIDSGPIVPFLNASTAASGMAVLGAASFGDDRWLGQLLTTLQLVGLPKEENGKLRYRTSNAVGDALMLYALVQGPLWQHVRERSAEREARHAGENTKFESR